MNAQYRKKRGRRNEAPSRNPNATFVRDSRSTRRDKKPPRRLDETAGARTFSLLRAAFALACEKRHARRFFGFPLGARLHWCAASASSRGTHGGMDRERGRRLRDALPRRGRLRSGRGMARVAGVQRGARGDDSRVRLSSFARINQNRSRRRLGRGRLFVVPQNARCATNARLTRLSSSVLYSSTENDAG